VAFDGTPLFCSGPHIGVTPDITLWRQHHPPLRLGEQAMCDKAYVGEPTCNAPFKKPPNGELDHDAKCLNALHSWFRGGVEHVIAQLKRFNILGLKFRGQLMKNGWSFLQQANTIISGIVAIQIQRKPLRVHNPLLSDDEKREAEAAAAEREAKEVPPAGLPVGDPWTDLVLHPDGSVEGHGDEPDGSIVDSGYDAEDFQAGQKVFVWFWGLWYRATIQYITKKGKLAIRWAWSRQVTSGYLPRLVSPIIVDA
jgi:hypothetical protein